MGNGNPNEFFLNEFKSLELQRSALNFVILSTSGLFYDGYKKKFFTGIYTYAGLVEMKVCATSSPSQIKQMGNRVFPVLLISKQTEKCNQLTFCTISCMVFRIAEFRYDAAWKLFSSTGRRERGAQ